MKHGIDFVVDCMSWGINCEIHSTSSQHISNIFFFFAFFFHHFKISVTKAIVSILGEALLVTARFVVYFGDMFACTIARLSSIAYGMEISEINTII